ncbi:hypothetical protein BJ742DRAFT_784470 [Cladochytrium replicatum]|nr:hypothetical protein BJ742DRAFT_784470 [Cladochytrium replicatum]
MSPATEPELFAPKHSTSKHSATLSEHSSHGPVPELEAPILRTITDLRRELKDLRKSTHDALTLADINHFCSKINVILGELKEVREQEGVYTDLAPTGYIFSWAGGRTRVDDALDALWAQLFAVWGKIAGVDQVLYPVYVKMVTLLRQLIAMKKSGAFTAEEINPIREQVQAIEEKYVRDAKFLNPKKPASEQTGDQVPPGQAVLISLLGRLRRLVAHLSLESDSVDPSLVPIHDSLVSAVRILEAIKHRGSYGIDSDLLPIQAELAHISTTHIRDNKVFAIIPDDPSALPPPAGQANLIFLMESAYDLVHELLATKDEVVGPLRPLYEELIQLRADLEEITRQHRHHPSEFLESEGVGSGPSVEKRVTEIQQRLSELEQQNKGEDGVFRPAGEDTTSIPAGQAAIHTIMHRCYALVHNLLVSMSEDPVSPELESTYELLQGVRDRLRSALHLAVSAKTAAEAAEKMPRKLETRLDDAERWIGVRERVRGQARDIGDVLRRLEQSSKVSGIWVGPEGASATLAIPEGQALVSSIANECFEQLQALQIFVGEQVRT